MIYTANKKFNRMHCKIELFLYETIEPKKLTGNEIQHLRCLFLSFDNYLNDSSRERKCGNDELPKESVNN